MTDTIFHLAPSPGERAKAALGRRNLVLVGLMGAGKSAIGRLVAQQLNRAGLAHDDQ
jgi:shikimate kinase